MSTGWDFDGELPSIRGNRTHGNRTQGEWIREDDREPLAVIREMLWPLEQLRAEATRAALSPESAKTD